MIENIRKALANCAGKGVSVLNDVEGVLRGTETTIDNAFLTVAELTRQCERLTHECAELRSSTGRAIQRFTDADAFRRCVERARDLETARADRLDKEAATLNRALQDSQAEVTRLKRALDATGWRELAAHTAQPSVPEPPPIDAGEAVTPMLIEWIERTAESCIAPLTDETISLIECRDAFGRSKYGQPLRLKDGRNTIEDARQEAGDLLQYLFKAYKNGEDPRPLIGPLFWIKKLFDEARRAYVTKGEDA